MGSKTPPKSPEEVDLATEDVNLAMASLFECESRTPEQCYPKGEVLLEALQRRDAIPIGKEDLDLETPNVDTTTQLFWTQWYDRDDPSGTGDWEPIWLEPSACVAPTGVVCLTTSWAPYWSTGDAVHCGLDGVWCENSAQWDWACDDYMVSYLCSSGGGGGGGGIEPL